jgi:hypothetical protein
MKSGGDHDAFGAESVDAPLASTVACRTCASVANKSEESMYLAVEVD